MICEECGKLMTMKEDRCAYCGRSAAQTIVYKKQKKIMLWIWSLVLLVSMLAIFTFFGQDIITFVTLLSDKFQILLPKSSFLPFL